MDRGSRALGSLASGCVRRRGRIPAISPCVGNGRRSIFFQCMYSGFVMTRAALGSTQGILGCLLILRRGE
jgi:hypothetical protein